MPSFRVLATAAMALFAATPALAHFQMAHPVPIAGSAPKDPLDPSGSNFPCHGANVGGYTGERQAMAVGSSQPLDFNLGGGANTAVHGGGSCQISLTYETDAAKLKDPSNWKVIHSFIGGCPTNAPGNLAVAINCAANGGSDCVNTFSFTIPEEVKNGNAILAWTWFNTIGNREMYMNCAAVTISGGSDKLDQLPSMFVANLASQGTCATTETKNVQFPNPGKYVTSTTGQTQVYQAAVPAGCGGSSGSSPSVISSATFVASTTSISSPTSSNVANSGTPSATSTLYTTIPETSSIATATTVPGGNFAQNPTTQTTLATQTASSTASTGATPSGSSGSCLQGQVQCSSQGFYCITEQTFGLCYNGCAYPQGVSAGTKCVKQEIQYARRHVRRTPPHARRSFRLF